MGVKERSQMVGQVEKVVGVNEERGGMNGKWGECEANEEIG